MFNSTRNERTLVARDLSTFQEACDERRAYVAKLPRKDGLVISALLFDALRHGSQEAGGFYVHPEARGWSLMAWLLSSAMIHRFANDDYDASVRVVAKVLKDNEAPLKALEEDGFENAGLMRLILSSPAEQSITWSSMTTIRFGPTSITSTQPPLTE